MNRALCPVCPGGSQPGASSLPRGHLAIFGDIFVSIVTTAGRGWGLLPASSGQKPGVMLNVLKCTDRRRRPRPSRQRPRRQTPAPSAVRFGPGGVPEGRPAVMRRELTERATAWDTGVRRDTPLDLTSGHTVARTPGREKQTPRAGRGLRTEPGVGLVPRGPRAECGAPRGCQRAGVGREAGTAQAAFGEDGPAKRTAPRVRGLPSVQGPDRGSRSTRNIRTPTVTSPPWSR